MVDVAWAPWMGTKHQRVASCANDGRLQLHLLTKKGATHGEVGGEWVHARSMDLDVGASDETVMIFAGFVSLSRVDCSCRGFRISCFFKDFLQSFVLPNTKN